MKDVVLIDSDIIAYRVGFTTQDLPVEIAEVRTDELIRRIVHETEAADYKCFLSGEENFRYGIYPAYKGNRVDKPKPTHLQAIREHIVRYHRGTVVNGYEADDELAMELAANPEKAICASIDKDLLQVPGWHYNFVKETTHYITPLTGLRNFYAQLILGDGADNIPGFDGKVRGECPKFIAKLIEPLALMEDEEEMYSYVLSVYEEENGNPMAFDHVKEIVTRNARLLYLWRKENDLWQVPNGLKHD